MQNWISVEQALPQTSGTYQVTVVNAVTGKNEQVLNLYFNGRSFCGLNICGKATHWLQS